MFNNNYSRSFCGVACLLLSAVASAQQYPQRPIRFVVGFAAGGPTDVIARITGQDIGAVLGQPVIVENRPGANAQIATELVARATPDGHTIVLGYIANLGIGPSLYAKLPFDPVKDRKSTRLNSSH